MEEGGRARLQSSSSPLRSSRRCRSWREEQAKGFVGVEALALHVGLPRVEVPSDVNEEGGREGEGRRSKGCGGAGAEPLSLYTAQHMPSALVNEQTVLSLLGPQLPQQALTALDGVCAVAEAVPRLRGVHPVDLLVDVVHCCVPPLNGGEVEVQLLHVLLDPTQVMEHGSGVRLLIHLELSAVQLGGVLEDQMEGDRGQVGGHQRGDESVHPVALTS